MRKFLTIFFLIPVVMVNAQTEEDFEEFGELVVRQLTRSYRYDSIPYIRVRELRDFLGERIADAGERKNEITKADLYFTKNYEIYQKSIFKILEAYRYSQKEGVTTKFLEIYHEPAGKIRDTYKAEIIFLYKTKSGVENEVTFLVDCAWYLDTFVLVGPVKEVF